MTPPNDTPAHIIQLWMEVSRLLRRNMMKKGKAADVCMNPMQVHAMMIITEHPNVTMKEFAKHLHISSPSATSFVDRLVKMKFVARVPDADNRKLVHLNILPAGRVSLESAMKEHSAVMHDLFSLLSGDDQRELERVLSNLKQALSHSVQPS
jgi:DNA-binding MarR family transcriptional regulator